MTPDDYGSEAFPPHRADVRAAFAPSQGSPQSDPPP